MYIYCIHKMSGGCVIVKSHISGSQMSKYDTSACTQSKIVLAKCLMFCGLKGGYNMVFHVDAWYTAIFIYM